MDLSDLHRELSKDPAYVREYEELGDSIALALHCRCIREEQRITQAQLAAEAGVSASAISRFEQLKGATEPVMEAIVRRLDPWLRKRGLQTEQWMRKTPPTHEPMQNRKRRTRIAESVPV